MRIGVCSVIYNPTSNELENLKQISKSGLPTFFYVNGALSRVFENADIIRSSENIGLSKAMNRIFKRGFNENLDAILFLDQDSILNIDKLYENYQLIINKLTENGLISLMMEETSQKNRLFINSGLILTKAAYENIGDFNENYFVDNIDYDYALRADILQYRVSGLKKLNIIDHYKLQPKQINVRNKVIACRNYESRFAEIFRGLRALIIIAAKNEKYGFSIKFLNIYVKELVKFTVIKLLGIK